jgi:hypothetical protein
LQNYSLKNPNDCLNTFFSVDIFSDRLVCFVSIKDKPGKIMADFYVIFFRKLGGGTGSILVHAFPDFY